MNPSVVPTLRLRLDLHSADVRRWTVQGQSTSTPRSRRCAVITSLQLAAVRCCSKSLLAYSFAHLPLLATHLLIRACQNSVVPFSGVQPGRSVFRAEWDQQLIGLTVRILSKRALLRTRRAGLNKQNR
jgi:hypothetical protein